MMQWCIWHQREPILQSGDRWREEVLATLCYHPFDREIKVTRWIVGVCQNDASVPSVRGLTNDRIEAWTLIGSETWLGVSRRIEKRELRIVGPACIVYLVSFTCEASMKTNFAE